MIVANLLRLITFVSTIIIAITEPLAANTATAGTGVAVARASGRFAVRLVGMITAIITVVTHLC